VCHDRTPAADVISVCGTVGKDDQGNPIGTGEGGCKGFIKWLALYEPKTAAALFAGVLPYYIDTSGEVPEVASEAEVEVMLKELGLPVGLIEHMQTAPAPLLPRIDVHHSASPLASRTT
jgi:hypothetical protein